MREKKKNRKSGTNGKLKDGRNKSKYISNHNKCKWTENLPIKGWNLIKWILENSALYCSFKTHLTVRTQEHQK